MKLIRFVLSVSVFCSVVLGGVWSKPELIGVETSAYLAVDNQGVCWCGGGPWIYAYHGEPLGWRPVTQTPWGGHPYFDRGDTLWLFADEMDFNICYARYDGNSWNEKVYVPVYPCANWGNKVTVDSNGMVWVAWTTEWWVFFKGAYNRYQNGHWGKPQPFPFLDTLEKIDQSAWDIRTDASGKVWVVWGRVTYDSVWHSEYNASYYENDHWSDTALTIVQGVGDRIVGPKLTPDPEGGMWALWYSKHNNDNIFQARYWDGSTWSSVDTIGNAGSLYNDWPPGGKIAVDKQGNAWAVWRQALVPSDTFGDIYYSVNTGSGWSEPAPVNEHRAVDQWPDIAVDGEGRVWCVWSSTRDDEYGIWASYTWGVGVEEPVTPVTQHLPSLTIDKSVGGEFTFSVSHSNIVRGIVICDASGRVVRDLTISDNQTIHWDGTDNKGQALSPGVYFARLSPTSSTLRLILIR